MQRDYLALQCGWHCVYLRQLFEADAFLKQMPQQSKFKSSTCFEEKKKEKKQLSGIYTRNQYQEEMKDREKETRLY